MVHLKVVLFSSISCAAQGSVLSGRCSSDGVELRVVKLSDVLLLIAAQLRKVTLITVL